jgi:hypothetical protein
MLLMQVGTHQPYDPKQEEAKRLVNIFWLNPLIKSTLLPYFLISCTGSSASLWLWRLGVHFCTVVTKRELVQHVG